MNRSSEENGRLSPSQSIVAFEKIHYLRMSYLNVLDSDLNKLVSFKTCCEKALAQMSEVGVKLIRNANILMQWNCVFRKHEMFPHPNIYVEMGKTETPIFLETFPEIKIK